MKRNLVVLLAMFLLTGASGCDGAASGTLQLTWTLTQGGAASSCAVGDQVWVTSSSSGSTVVDKFNCSAKGGSFTLRPGSWSVLVELRDAANALVVPGATVTAIIQSNAITNLGLVTFDLGVSTGTISATWMVTKNGALSTCAAVGAASLTISSTPVGGGSPITDTFTCSDMAGTQADLAPGDYHVAINLWNAANQSLNLVNVSGVIHVSAGANSQIPNLVFAF